MKLNNTEREMQMDILYITFDPIESRSSAMIRNIGVIRGLIENGHNVEILTIAPNVNQKSNNEEKIFSKLKIYKIGSSNVYNVIEKDKGKIKDIISKVLKKTYKKLIVYNNTYFVAKKINKQILQKNKYDIVISSSDPKTSHVVARKLRKDGLIAQLWIQYWGDPMSLDITNTTIWPKWIIKIFERNLLKYADSIVYVSPFTYKIQVSCFKKYKEKMRFLPVPYINTKQYNINKDLKKEKLKIAYLGSYYSKIRNILPLYEAVSSLTDETELVIAGLTDLRLNDTSNIKVYPNLPKGDVEILEDKSDIIVCILNKTGTQIPGKLYHYAGTNKPILVITDGEYANEIRNYLEGFNRYYFCNNNKEEIAKTLIELKNDCYLKSQPVNLLSPKYIAEIIIDPKKSFKF